MMEWNEADIHCMYLADSYTPDRWISLALVTAFLPWFCFVVPVPVWRHLCCPKSAVRHTSQPFHFSGSNFSSVNNLDTSSTENSLSITDWLERWMHIDLSAVQRWLKLLRFLPTDLLTTVQRKQKLARDVTSKQFCLNSYHYLRHF